jgi:SulP family sulfate permease
MAFKTRFNRFELAGSLGDLGTILPLALGMIMINGLDAMSLFLCVGLYYVFSGAYFRVTTPVQPMKVIGAYAVATGISACQIMASGAILGIVLIIIGGTKAINFLGRHIPKATVRGVQLSTGVLLITQGVKLMLGTSEIQAHSTSAEPFLAFQSIGALPLGILLGVLGGVATLLLIENRRLPAGLIIILGGLALGLFLGTREGLDQLRIGMNLPKILPFGIPSGGDFLSALLLLVLPQLPMTLGNAVVAEADLSREYFGEASKKVTYRSLCISMGLANLGSYVLGGMPLCHGAGGLAAHYRFGARTAGSNFMIGAIFIFFAVFLGSNSVALFTLIPMAVLGVLLIFAGSQLALTLLDVGSRKDLFVCVMILGLTIASNLAVGFLVGIGLAYALKWNKMSI